MRLASINTCCKKGRCVKLSEMKIWGCSTTMLRHELQLHKIKMYSATSKLRLCRTKRSMGGLQAFNDSLQSPHADIESYLTLWLSHGIHEVCVPRAVQFRWRFRHKNMSRCSIDLRVRSTSVFTRYQELRVDMRFFKRHP